MTPDEQVRIARAQRWLYLLCAIAFAVLVALGFGTIFHGDEWDFITQRSFADPVSLLRPFNDQWMTVPATIYRALFEVFHLNSYVPYLAVLIGLHVLLPIVVFRIVVPWSGPIVAFFVAVMVLVSGYGHENLFWAFQIGMVGSTLAGFAAFEVLLRPEGRRWLAALLVLVSLASHPVGAAFLVAAGVLAVGRRDRKAVAWLAVPALVLLWWIVTFQLPGLSSQGSTMREGLLQVPRFIMLGLGASAAAVFGIQPELGLVLLGGAAVLLLVLRRGPVDATVVLACFAGIAAEFGLIALVRSQFGDQATSWARYMYVSLPFLAIALAAWIGRPSIPAERLRVARAVAVVVVVVALAGNVRTLILGRGAALTWGDRARAVAYLAETKPDLPEYYIIQLPPPSRLRSIQAEYGRLDRDALLGVAFARPSADSIRYICDFYYEGDPSGAADCAAKGSAVAR